MKQKIVMRVLKEGEPFAKQLLKAIARDFCSAAASGAGQWLIQKLDEKLSEEEGIEEANEKDNENVCKDDGGTKCGLQFYSTVPDWPVSD